MNAFSGSVLFLDRSDINTDEIIPAKYLTEISRDALAPYLLRISAWRNSTRPWISPAKASSSPGPTSAAALPGTCALGIGGQRDQPGGGRKLCPHLPPEHVQLRHDGRGTAGRHDCAAVLHLRRHETTAVTDVDAGTITFSAEGKTKTVPFTLSGFDADLVAAGGWVDYADANF